MRTDPRADVLRRVDDDSPWYDKALWHAVTALEEIAEESGTTYASAAERGLRGVDAALQLAPEAA